MKSITLFTAMMWCIAASLSFGRESSLVLYLPMDEGAGAVASDESGNGQHAQLKGPIIWEKAKDTEYKTATRFGKDAYGVIPHHDLFNLTDAMTLMCWARIDGDFGDQQMAIEKGTAWVVGEYSLLPDFEDQVLIQAFDLDNGCREAIRGGDVRDGKWHHLAGTWDGKEFRLYVDGAEKAKLACPGKLKTNSDPLFIASRNGKERWTNGTYDEIRIYSEALSANDIRRIYAALTPPGLAVAPGDKAAVRWASLKKAP